MKNTHQCRAGSRHNNKGAEYDISGSSKPDKDVQLDKADTIKKKQIRKK